MRKHRAEQLDADFEAIRHMRKRPIIDRLKWVDPSPASCSIPGVTQHSHRFTLQDVDATTLAAVAARIPSAPIALAEVAIDFWPPISETFEERAVSMERAYMALQRRLVPGSGVAQSPRAIAIDRPRAKNRNFLPADAGKILRSASGADVIREEKELSPFTPRISGGGQISSHTIYLGHQPKESWSHLQEQPSSRAQVRLYIKTTDHRADLPEHQHRVRLEITLNGPSLVECLGVSTIAELAEANLRPLATTYLRLARPVAAQSRVRVPGRRNRVMQALLQARVVGIEKADADSAMTNGNFTKFDGGNVDFRTDPRMTELLADALYDYTRAVKRARTSGRFATLTAPRRARLSPKSLIRVEDLSV